MTPTDHRDAHEIATLAGELLLGVRSRVAADGLEGKEVGEAGDREANALILDEIALRHPGDRILSEESADDVSRVDASRVWIVDPLDGSREFGELDRDDWAVHVALWEAGALVAGAVALPAQGVTLSTAEPPRVPAPSGGAPRLVVSRSRPPAMTDVIRDVLGAELVPMGSAGAKAMAVVQGKADVYAHAGGQKEWDNAAPAAVALAAGLHATRLDGAPLRYNNADPWLPDLLICRPELAQAVIDAAGAFDAAD